MGYVYQHPDFGLGNFINLTPAIAWLHHTQRERVPVYFSTEYVRQCFLDWKAIEILDQKPDNDPLFGSNLVNPHNDQPDYKYVFEHITGQDWHPDWHTYVDNPALTKLEKIAFSNTEPFIVVICGSGSDSPNYFALKDPGEEEYWNMVYEISKGLNIYAVGSGADAARSPWLNFMSDECFFGDIRTALKIIYASKLVISNDCGLAHAAGAMNKPLTILWKDTPRERCKNAGVNTKYLYL